jgi:hypothetical protein
MMEAESRPPITSRSEFHAAIRGAFESAAKDGSREIWLTDPDFADWPLSETELLANLTAWAQSHRKITLVAESFDEMARRHTRWTAWRRQWSHIVECRTNAELERGQMPTLLLASGLVSVRLLDRVHYRGTVSALAADLVLCKEAVDAVLQRSAEAFPVTTLGL